MLMVSIASKPIKMENSLNFYIGIKTGKWEFYKIQTLNITFGIYSGFYYSDICLSNNIVDIKHVNTNEMPKTVLR